MYKAAMTAKNLTSPKVKRIVTIIVISLSVLLFLPWIIKLIKRVFEKILPASVMRPKIRPQDMPNNGTGIPKGWTPSSITEKISNRFFGYNLFSNVSEVYSELKNLTDDQLVAVNKDWDKRYRTDKKISLYKKFTDEISYLQQGTIDRLIVLANMERLGLTT